jgi:hypothetical protein
VVEKQGLEEKLTTAGKADQKTSRLGSKRASDPRTNLLDLQKTIGNRAVQCLLNHPKVPDAFDVDEQTADRIQRGRSSGQSLDTNVSTHIGEALGANFEQVRIHTNPEADTLNRQLGAKAFTTGQDIFFREGAYEPATSSGQKLIAHELTHVVQQASGAVGAGGSRMTVRAPGDRFEKQADQLANAATSPASPADVQRQVEDEEAA